jgi:hypothetical protein
MSLLLFFNLLQILSAGSLFWMGRETSRWIGSM